MRNFIILIFCTLLNYVSIGQRNVENFPPLSTFLVSDFVQTDNIFPIAAVTLDIDGTHYRIPISYSLMHHKVDTSAFLIQGDFIDNYSFKILNNGKVEPMFTKKALVLPDDWKPYLAQTRQKMDSMKSKIDLSTYLKFSAQPEWLQNDETPISQDGSIMKFICQIELGDFIPDDCWLYIFFDPKSKLVKHIYQRT